MAYYVKDRNGSVYAFATRKDAFVYVCDHLGREGSKLYVYKDRACKEHVGAVQFMGWNTFNFYRNGLDWDGQTPAEVDPKSGMLYNPFAKKK